MPKSLDQLMREALDRGDADGMVIDYDGRAVHRAAGCARSPGR